jgi:uncharacterized protein DUF3221
LKKTLILLVASLAMLSVAAAVAVAQTEPGNSVQGFITDISGAVVLVEEDPADEAGSAKGYFTVTGETEILRQQGGTLVPATFDELRVGQVVAAEYTGPILESYPPQGAAGSIVILEEPAGGVPADDELLCLIPEGCDTDGDGVPDLQAGEPAPDERSGADLSNTPSESEPALA